MNTGAILNRINFGLAVAANRIPGAGPATLPGIDSLRNASRPAQVDAVVSLLLSGMASPDTRAVLLKGENPLAANAPSQQSAQTDMGGSANSDGSEAMTPERRRANQLSRGFSSVPQLSGVAQIVGLALGSPEFQRR